MLRQAVAVFGSTGSVGGNTIDVIQRNTDRYYVDALIANKNVDAIFAQCLQLMPRLAALADREAAAELAARLRRHGSITRVLTDGETSLCQLASDPKIPIIMAAIVGFAGLAPTLAAAESGKKILLANKESMVVAGDLLNRAVQKSGALLVPVDSEHNAIFQCLSDMDQRKRALHERKSDVVSIVLTASGGPFRTWSHSQMKTATIAQATKHPNWSMGSKISVDSATMMNKGLEVIEACYLFGIDESLVEVVVHPQSIVHSMVRYRDGSVLAQMGNADMRTPIANALAWPQRVDAGVGPLDLMQLNNMQFEMPDTRKFPCLELARHALRRGGAATGVLNAANEVAVESFLGGSIRFLDISRINAHALKSFDFDTPSSVKDLIGIDKAVRQRTRHFIECGFTQAEVI